MGAGEPGAGRQGGLGGRGIGGGRGGMGAGGRRVGLGDWRAGGGRGPAERSRCRSRVMTDALKFCILEPTLAPSAAKGRHHL